MSSLLSQKLSFKLYTVNNKHEMNKTGNQTKKDRKYYRKCANNFAADCTLIHIFFFFFEITFKIHHRQTNECHSHFKVKLSARSFTKTRVFWESYIIFHYSIRKTMKAITVTNREIFIGLGFISNSEQSLR